MSFTPIAASRTRLPAAAGRRSCPRGSLEAGEEAPEPLRSEDYPEGFPWLQDENLRRVQQDNNLFKNVVRFLQRVAKAGGCISLETPTSSYFWETKWAKWLYQETDCQPVKVNIITLGARQVRTGHGPPMYRNSSASPSPPPRTRRRYTFAPRPGGNESRTSPPSKPRTRGHCAKRQPRLCGTWQPAWGSQSPTKAKT